MLMHMHKQDVTNDIQSSLAKGNTVAEECLSSMRTVRSFANEDAEFQVFKEKLGVTLKIYSRKAIFYGAWMLSNNVSTVKPHLMDTPQPRTLAIRRTAQKVPNMHKLLYIETP